MTRQRCLYTLDEWQKLTPYQQGYALYMESSWPGSPLAEQVNPYAEGTLEHAQFQKGEHRATLNAQDSEE